MNKIVSIIFVLSLLSFGFSNQAEASSTFTDVPSSAEYYKEVNYIASKGIISGYNDKDGTYFKPSNNVTRFQAAKMLVIATKNDTGNATSAGFSDIKDAHTAYYVNKAVELGYFTGYKDGTFKPNQQLTRGQMSKILANALSLDEKITMTNPLMFKDVPLNYENATKINGLYYKGITQGSKLQFSPYSPLTRAQFSLFLARGLSSDFTLPVSSISQTFIAQGNVTEDLNIRNEASVNGQLIGKFPKGTEVQVVKDLGQFVEVRYLQRPAYVSKSYINFLDANSNPIGNATHFVQVTTNDLNIRSNPSAGSVILGKYNTNDIVEVYSQIGDWLLVVQNDIPGYIHSAYTKDYTAPVLESDIKYGDLLGKVTVSGLNVRIGPSTTFAVSETLNTGHKVTVLALENNWAKIQTSNGVGYVSKTYLKLINQNAHVLKDRIIVVDAGHGGTDPGATRSGYYEKTIALKVSKLVESKLKAKGAKVVMTRVSDVYPSLDDRIALSKAVYAEAFISIHVNAAESTSARGTEVFFDTSANDNGIESKYLATEIHNKILSYADMYNRGVKDTGFKVIKYQDIPAVLVEMGFISNPADFAKLTSDAYLEKYAEAIYQGILQYYSKP